MKRIVIAGLILIIVWTIVWFQNGVNASPSDAIVCGNAICEQGEDAKSCPRDCMVKEIKFIHTGLKPEWSPSGTPSENLILFHRKDTDGDFDVFRMNPDGSDEVCLTCNKPGLPNRHMGAADWHPSGEYIVFQAEKQEYFGDHDYGAPAIGYYNDVWLMDSEGTNFYQLTDLETKMSLFDPTPVTGVLQPHFSNDGTKLFWGQRLGGGGWGGWTTWGEWAIKIADFNDPAKVPPEEILTNISTYQPGHQPAFYETNDMSSDDSKLLFSGTLEEGQEVEGIDLYTMDISTGTPLTLTNLTETMDVFEESGHYSPDDRLIAYLSTMGYPTSTDPFWWHWAKTDFWLMREDGSEKVKLTYYNEPGTVDYASVGGSRVMASYLTWSPDGTKIMMSIAIENPDGTFRHEIGVIDFGEDPFRCGNGKCEIGEDVGNCPQDCGSAATTTPTPTATKTATSTPIPTATPTSTPTAPSTSSPTPTVTATGTIQGTVTDARTRRKLSGVLVNTDTGQSATTSRNGKYTMNNVPEGTRMVTASKAGYTTQQQQATVTASRETTLNFALVRQ